MIKIVQMNVSKLHVFLRISSLITKDQTENIICTMDDVWGDFLGLPHGTTPAAVLANKKVKLSSFKSRDNINEKGDGSCHHFGY